MGGCMTVWYNPASDILYLHDGDSVWTELDLFGGKFETSFKASFSDLTQLGYKYVGEL